MKSAISYAILALTLTACTTSFDLTAGESPNVTSAYSEQSTEIGEIDVSSFIRAPLRNTVMAILKSDALTVQAVVANEIDQWADQVVTVDWDHSNSVVPGKLGVGSVRICTFKNGKIAYEPILAYVPGELLAYTFDTEKSTQKLPIEDVFFIYTFETRDENQTLMTLRTYYAGKGLPGVMAPVLLGRQLRASHSVLVQNLGGELIDPNP